MLHHHAKLERKSVIMLLFIIVTVLIGGIVEIIPLFRMETVIEPVKGVRPYTPLEIGGFNIYIREGCYNCHSQQIRPLRDEVARYGHYSLAAEYVWPSVPMGFEKDWPGFSACRCSLFRWLACGAYDWSACGCSWVLSCRLMRFDA